MSKNLKDNNVPELRFSDFREDLRKTTLAKIVNFSSGGTPSKANPEYWNGDIPWISASSMYEDILIDSENKITELGLNNGSRLALKNSILILVRGSILYNRIPISITGKNVAFNQDVKALEINKNVNQNYLFFWFKYKEHFIKSIVTGTGIGAGKIDTSQLKSLSIFLPKLEEQEKIASFLDSVALRITQLRRKHELLETYKKGVMQKIFSQQIRFKQDDGKPFPDWEKKSFGNIVAKISSKYDPTTNNVNYPCIELESIISNEGKLIKIFDSKEQQSIKNKFKSEDVLFGKLRPYLRKFIYANFEGVCSTEIWVLRGKSILNKYLYYLIQTDKFSKISNVTFGSKMPRSDWDFISSFPFLSPCFKEQEKIANFLTSIDKKIEAVGLQIEAMEEFKKGLLQKMFV